jgi:DNA-binding PadR family transcriptional regulator
MLGELEQVVVLAVMRLGDEAYGVPVRDQIQRRTGRDLSLATVYTTLSRLEDKGLIAARVGDPSPHRGGRRKRFYTVSTLGKRAVREALGSLRKMAHGLSLGADLP